MGEGNTAITQSLVPLEPPNTDEVELTVFGPGYGESIALHVGGGEWLIVDSCVNEDGIPRSLSYLESIGVDPCTQVKLIVSTHWHDDHIRGIAEVFTRCENASFCCAAALSKKDFLTAIHALEKRNLSSAGSGAREMYQVFSILRKRCGTSIFAYANRRIFSGESCEIWSLSPDDAEFQIFLQSIGALVPAEGKGKIRIPGSDPNNLSIVLWVRMGDVVALLGADLERSGWIKILESCERPKEKASVFKIPHHGSLNAYQPGVWRQMLDPKPVAVLTPWRRGGKSLPQKMDIERILSHTSDAFASADQNSVDASRRKREKTVEKTIRGSGISLRSMDMPYGVVQLRRNLERGKGWRIQTYGSACKLKDFFD